MKTNHPLSRRHFLATALAAGAAPFILPSGVWAAQTPKNSIINLGFVGMGTQNRGLMRGFIGRQEVRVLAVCDVDRTRREDAKNTVDTFYKEHKDFSAPAPCVAYSDFRELIARKDLDGVVVATPDHWHSIIAIAALKAGKDVYCEKPMAHSIAEARAMVKAVRKNKRVLQVGSMQRSSREFRASAELIRNGCLGKLTKVEVAVGGPAVPCNLPEEPLEPGCDWNMWLGPAPLRPYTSTLSPRGVHKHFPDWRNYREYGGGGVTDWGAHHFDIPQWGMGYDASGPIEITPPGTPGAQSGVVLLYPNGVEVHHTGGNGLTFFGENGKLFVNRGQFKLWIDGKQKAEDISYCEPILKEMLPANAVRLYDSPHHLADWLGCMRSRKLPICDVEVGARTVSVCELVNLAYYHGKKLKWDPSKEAFVGGTGDPAWLHPIVRAPWKAV